MLLAILLFLDFSGGEFLLIAVVFLMFFGSKSIPGMARTLGKAVREFKDAANTVQREIHENASIEETREITKPSPASADIPQQTESSAPFTAEGTDKKDEKK